MLVSTVCYVHETHFDMHEIFTLALCGNDSPWVGYNFPGLAVMGQMIGCSRKGAGYVPSIPQQISSFKMIWVALLISEKKISVMTNIVA